MQTRYKDMNTQAIVNVFRGRRLLLSALARNTAAEQNNYRAGANLPCKGCVPTPSGVYSNHHLPLERTSITSKNLLHHTFSAFRIAISGTSMYL